MIQSKAQQILEILRREFTRPKWITSTRDPFETLIVTIISQNTSDQNARRAFEKLANTFQVTPEDLANAEIKKLEECLRTAGLYRNKAKVIKEISRIILESFDGSLEKILNMPLNHARSALMQLPGVGAKTADVLLLFSANKPTIPVDTHVNRVSKRLGLAPADGDYEDVREALQQLYPPSDYMDVHMFLILLGRKYCLARNPRCYCCPVISLCPSKAVYA